MICIGSILKLWVYVYVSSYINMLWWHGRREQYAGRGSYRQCAHTRLGSSGVRYIITTDTYVK